MKNNINNNFSDENIVVANEASQERKIPPTQSLNNRRTLFADIF